MLESMKKYLKFLMYESCTHMDMKGILTFSALDSKALENCVNINAVHCSIKLLTETES